MSKRTRLALGFALVVVMGVLAVMVTVPSLPSATPTSPVPSRVPSASGEKSPAVEPEVSVRTPPKLEIHSEADFRAHIAEIERACGFTFTTVCEGGACAANLVVTPGWRDIGIWLNHPWFAMENVTARVLGLDPTEMECGAAYRRIHSGFGWTHIQGSAEWWQEYQFCPGWIEGVDSANRHWVDDGPVLMPLCAKAAGVEFVPPNDWEVFRH
jgi:hypothetical protein